MDPWEGGDKANDGELDTDASNNTLETDPINRDSDGDMLGDGKEVNMGPNKNKNY